MSSIRLPLLGLFALFATLGEGQFVDPPNDLIKKTGYAGVDVRYKEVPTGICELNPAVKSYSGYADVAENQHMFWMFFETRNGDPTTAPLTLWISGGPGASSMYELWQELGPCLINSSIEVNNNPYSWNEFSNMIFIDQPIQTGLSYSVPTPGYVDPEGDTIANLPDNTCSDWASDWDCGKYSRADQTTTANSTVDAAPNVWKTLQGFVGVFPPEINLESVLIGNGWYDPLIQNEAYYNFSVQPGNTYDILLDKDHAHMMYNAIYGPGNCRGHTLQCYNTGRQDVCQDADNFCSNEVEAIYKDFLHRDVYDVRELIPDPIPPDWHADYLNTERIQKAIGAYVNYTSDSAFVSQSFSDTGDDSRVFSIIQDMRDLVAANLTVVMYFADADFECKWIGGYAVAEEIGVSGFEKAGFVNITTGDDIVHGQVKQVGKFSFVRIFESGHSAPFYQPLVSMEMVERAINGFDIATGKTKVGPTYQTVGSPTSTYHEGNATVQYEPLPSDAFYNTTTNEPERPPSRMSQKQHLPWHL
ncbi:alpha/beta-hydrolase [Viridothelium virens]|uniref:Alpha/beta-hydrolase n=1 Tax=Viridothelium virens TaxID=1048519 RepID=A0A6A6GTA0_VIRVR|nr:alpha/beta-hydrolase [Viridothelium virens]